MDHPHCNIGNICNGAVPEVFDRAVKEVFQNLKDVNTESDQKRVVALEFHFEPFADRSGAEVRLVCKTKLSGVKAVTGTVFATGQGDKMQIMAKDPRQDELFGAEPASSAVS